MGSARTAEAVLPGRFSWGEVHGSCATQPAAQPQLAQVISLDAHRQPGQWAPITRSVLTRRGRLARTLAMAFAVALVALWVADRVQHGSPVESVRVATVSAGQSLTDIAAAELPSMATSEAISALRVFNDLASTTVYAGQSIRIPAL